MELVEVMKTTHTCRYYRTDDVPDAVLREAIDSARFGPSGGNRQPVHWLIVRDSQTKRTLKDLYLPLWKADLAQFLDGSLTAGVTELGAAVAAADHFAEHLDEAPVIIVACALAAEMHPQCLEDGRLNLIAGASVYPMVQNLLLALREKGVATSLTTLLCDRELEVKGLLGLPDGVVTACHIAAGYPARPFPTRLSRRPTGDLVSYERYGRRRD